jgi:hypothetical protein
MASTKLRASTQIYFDANIDVNAKKLTNLLDGTSAQDAVTKAQLDALADNINAFQLKGVLDCSANPNYPAASAGHIYRISIAGKIGGASGKAVAQYDLIECLVDSSAAGDQATVGTNWNHIPYTAGSGSVSSSSGSSTDNAIARMDATSGQIIQTSLATIDDNGSVNIPSGQNYKINGTALSATNVGAEPTITKGNLTETTSSVLTITGGTGAVIGSGLTIQVKAANGSQSGYLSTSDWTTFNNKQAALGFTPLQQSGYVCREVPAGTKNGSNTAFTLANTPVAGSEMIFVGGALMNAGAGNDYTISGTAITFAVAPLSTDIVLATYWK